MSFTELLNTIKDYRQEIDDSHTITELTNDAFSDWLSIKGISRVALLDSGKLLLNINGRLKSPPRRVGGIHRHTRFILINLDELEDVPEALEEALTHYISEGDGAYVWVIPDGFMASLTEAEQEWEKGGSGYFSHESICISNTADIDTRCQLEVLYEDASKEKVTCEFEASAHRSIHYRLDKLKDENDHPLIAKDAPVSYKLTSFDARIVVQGSRILTSGEGSEFASFGTVMAWCPQQRR